MSDTKNSIDLSRRKLTAEGVQVFSSLMEMVEKDMENLVDLLEESQEMAQQVSGNPLQGLQRLQSMNIQGALRKKRAGGQLPPTVASVECGESCVSAGDDGKPTDEESG